MPLRMGRAPIDGGPCPYITVGGPTSDSDACPYMQAGHYPYGKAGSAHPYK